MPHELVLRDHRAVQHAVARTAVAGAAAGVLHAFNPGVVTDAAILFLVGACAVFPRSLRSAATAAALACGGAGAAAALGGTAGAAGFGLAGALMFARDADGGIGRRLLALASGALALVAAGFVYAGLRGGIEGLASPALALVAAGGAAGFLAGFGVLGREVDAVPVLPPAAEPPKLATAGAAEATADATTPTATGPAGALVVVAAGATEAIANGADGGEVGELLARARTACSQIEKAVGGEVPGAVQAAADLLRRISAFATRWREIERQVAESDREALKTRMERMTERALAATDDVVRAEYERAAAVLKQQLDDLDAICGWQARALARLHHHVAVLERLRFAALHRRSVESGRSGEELQPLVEELSAASLDLDGAAEVLAELPA